MITKALKTGIILASLCATVSIAGTINVIVNKSIKLESLDPETIKAIYMARRTDFPNGKPAVALDVNEDSELYESFYQNVIHKDVADVNSYWSRKMFTGGGTPPRQITDEDELIELVANNPQYIAYIEGEVTSDKVKVVYSTATK